MINLNQVALFGTAYNYSEEPGPSWVFPETTSETSGSLEFARLAEPSYIEYAGSNDWAVGTGEFTIEFWMFMQQNDFFPRIFSIGTYDTIASLAVSIESGQVYFWMNGSPSFGYSLDDPYETWNHIAITRDDESILRLYVNGTKVAEQSNATEDIIDNTRSLLIGTENVADSQVQFRGYITGFRWAKGEALYTSETFLLPIEPILSTPGTKLLLNAISSETFLDDDSSVERSQTGSDQVQWTNYVPY
jgi:hypothetical protein